MKRKIFLIVLLVSFFFIFDRGAALLFREASYSFYSNTKIKKSVFGKREVIKEGFYDSIIFGTSRTLNAVHPFYLYKYLGLKAYKVAKQDRYPEYYFHLYKKFRDSFGKPGYLFYGVDYFMFDMRTSHFPLMTVYKKKRNLRKINLKKVTNKNSRFLSSVSMLYRIKKKIDKTIADVLYKFSLEWDLPEKEQTNITGISNYLGKKMVISTEFRTRPDSWEKFPYTNSDNGEGPFLKRLFDELEKDGVKVFLIGIPDYIGTYESNIQKDKFVSDINNLIKNRNGFWFLNYNHPDHFDMENGDFFKDGQYGEKNSHLSYFGSIPFNKMLSEDIGRIIKGEDPVNNIKTN